MGSVEQDHWYTTAEAARLFDVDRRTVLRWAKAGLIDGQRTLGGHFRLPASEVRRLLESKKAGLSSSPAQDGGSGPQRFVLVDDDRGHSRAFGRMLKRLFPAAEIVAAPDGFSGGLLVERLRPDVLFLDLEMPGLSGLDVARRLRDDVQIQDLQIVIVTGAKQVPSSSELRGLGIAHLFKKPVSEDVLSEVIPALTGVSSEPPSP